MNQFEKSECNEGVKETVSLSEFKQLPIWLCWRYEKKNNSDRPTKVPYGADGIAIGTTQEYSGRWTTFEVATRAYKKLGFDGVGFVIPKGFGGIESDHRKECDPINADLIEHFQTYAENSPSKNRRLWIFKCDTSAIPNQDGKLDNCYYCKNPNNDLEIYFGGMTNRFLTFTGDVVSDLPIEECTEAALWFLDKYMLRPALPDAPDIAPCAFLTLEQGIAPCAFLTLEQGIAKAIQGCREIYTPDYCKGSVTEDFSEEDARRIASSLIKPAIEAHLASMDPYPPNDAMIQRLENALANGQKIEGADASFYLHEFKEVNLMAGGMGYTPAHEAALEYYGVSRLSVYHPDVIKSLPSWFNDVWKSFWGLI